MITRKSHGKGGGQRCGPHDGSNSSKGRGRNVGQGGTITFSKSEFTGKGGQGKGKHPKVGSTMEMGGVTLVAVEKDGRLVWEPAACFESTSAQKQALPVDVRWIEDSAVVVQQQRIAQAHRLLQSEQQRKANAIGVEHVYRTHRLTWPHVPAPKLLIDTRAEDKQAREAGMDKLEPKKYQFIKESLIALERKYAEQLRTARENAYDRTRVRCRLADCASPQDELESVASQVDQMTDEEFKALAIERKQRADVDISSHRVEAHKTVARGVANLTSNHSTTARKGRGRGGKKK